MVRGQPKQIKIKREKMELINFTPHILNFSDGSMLEPSGIVINITWKDQVIKLNGLELVKRQPVLNNDTIKILNGLGKNQFGIVSFPVVSAVRNTKFEGKVGGVIMESRTKKVAKVNKFSI